jgi:hypothetical protein
MQFLCLSATEPIDGNSITFGVCVHTKIWNVNFVSIRRPSGSVFARSNRIVPSKHWARTCSQNVGHRNISFRTNFMEVFTHLKLALILCIINRSAVYPVCQ